MAKVGSLLIDLAMNTARLQADAGKAAQTIGRMERNFGRSLKGIEREFGKLTRGIRGFAGALGIAVGAGGLAAMTKNSIDAADKIGKLSDRLGISTNALSEYQHVAELSGVTFETLTMGFQRMTRRISEAAQGSGEAKDAIHELGLSAQDLAELAPDKQFEAIAAAMEGVSDQGDRVRLAMKLFDSEGVALVQTMTNGADGIAKMRDEARSLGLSMDGNVTKQAASANDALTRINATVRALGLEIIPMAAPIIEGFASVFRETLLPAMNAVMKVIHGVNAGTAFLAAGVADFFGFESDADALFARFDEAMRRIEALETGSLRGIKAETEVIFGELMDSHVRYYDQRVAAAKDMQIQMADIEQSITTSAELEAKKRIQTAEFEAKATRERLNATADIFMNLSTLMASESRKTFEIGKAAAIAETVISTYASAQKVFEFWANKNPYIGYAAAAATVVAGLQRVQAIRSTQFGSSGSAPSSNGNPGTPGGNQGLPQIGGNGSVSQQRQVTIQFSGDVNVLTERQLQDVIVEAVRAADDADVFLISGTGANAQRVRSGS